MCCQNCPHRSVPNDPNIPIKPWIPYPHSYTTSTPTIPYYWGQIIPVSEEDVIIQNFVNSKDFDPKFMELINENFWELV